MMYNTSNPAELYPGTTWQLLPENKLLKTGSTPLQQGGSNSLKLSKANLPAEKLQVDSFSLSIKDSYLSQVKVTGGWNTGVITVPKNGTSNPVNVAGDGGGGCRLIFTNTETSLTSGTATPYTTAMGSGTPLAINPEHITIRAWKRLT